MGLFMYAHSTKKVYIYMGQISYIGGLLKRSSVTQKLCNTLYYIYIYRMCMMHFSIFLFFSFENASKYKEEEKTRILYIIQVDDTAERGGASGGCHGDILY